MKPKNEILNEFHHDKNNSEDYLIEMILDIRDNLARIADALEKNQEIKKINV